MLKDILESAPKIIAEAAKSPLGISALLILAVSTLAWMFFGDSTEIFKAIVFIAVLVVFIIIVHYSYTYSVARKDVENEEPTATDNDSAQEVTVTQLPHRESIKWRDPLDKDKDYELTALEVQILEAMRGKPDVRWTEEILLSNSRKPVDFTKEELAHGLENLEKNRYLGCNKEGIYHVMDLAVLYYRATANKKIYEIDEADYWNGSL